MTFSQINKQEPFVICSLTFEFSAFMAVYNSFPYIFSHSDCYLAINIFTLTTKNIVNIELVTKLPLQRLIPT